MTVQGPPQAPVGPPPPPTDDSGATAPRPEPVRASALRAKLSQTPGQLVTAMVIAIVLIATAGTTAATAMLTKSDTIDSTRLGSGKLAVTSSELYQSLSEANAAASATFLIVGSVPASMQDTYETSIRDASQALSSAATQVSSESDANTVAELNVALTTYTGLVETARTYHRMDQPVNMAHLRLASTMMRNDILPLAADLRSSAQSQLDDDQETARATPWIAFAAAIVALVFLIAVSVWLKSKTNRVFNLGLTGATIAMIALAGWLILSSLATASHLDRAQTNGGDPYERISSIQISAQEARASESLLFVSRGEDDTAAQDFADNMEVLAGDDAELQRLAEEFPNESIRSDLENAALAARTWQDRHHEVLSLMREGDYTEALDKSVGTADGSVANSFDLVDEALTQASESAGARFDNGLHDAQRALSGTAIGLGVLAALAIASVSIGLQQRIREYHA